MSLHWLSLITIITYFGLLLLVSWLTGRGGSNDVFFRAGHKSPWYLVAFGMIGASISGVSFVSVPGYVGLTQMTYLQMCLGFFLGYVVVAYVLLPVYYRRGLTTIYSYLADRLGQRSRKTGAAFFVLSKRARASASFCLVCMILQQFVFGFLGVPFWLTVVLLLLLVWLYTRRGGIRTLVYTDTLQTLCMLATLVAVICIVAHDMHLDLPGLWQTVSQDPRSKIFEWGNWQGKQTFWKQFLSGIFIVIVMTGLDQDMMQKNLTCRDLRSAQKDMCSYGACFAPVNLLFLVLGILLYQFAASKGILLPAKTDEVFPSLVSDGYFGYGVTLLFVLGITAAAFSSVDSALTALTTTLCIDILDIDRYQNRAEQMRKRVHIAVVAVFVVATLLFRRFNGTSVLDAIYVMASYTYGPLLGLFAFGLISKRQPQERWIPAVCIASPLICYALSITVPRWTGYTFGYELLILNGLLTYIGLLTLSLKYSKRKIAH